MTESNVIHVLTPVGRLVAGGPYEKKTKDYRGQPLTIKRGPNAGQPRIEYYIGLALPKSDPATAAIKTAIDSVCQEHYPNQFVNGQPSPNLSVKYTDGDSAMPNKNGIAPSSRDGWPGHYVFHFSTSRPIQVFKNEGGTYYQQTNPECIKLGDYIRVSGNVRSNGQDDNPGVYLNADMVELIAAGPEIERQSSIPEKDPTAVFGAAPVGQLPPGAQITNAPPDKGFHAGPPPTAPPVSTPPTAPPTAPPVSTPPVSTPPTAPPEIRYEYEGRVFTEAELLSYNWTLEQIKKSCKQV